MAIAYRQQNNVWSRADVGFVDAKETSSPPDSTKYDRRLEFLGIAGFDWVATPRFGLRFNAKSSYMKRRQAEMDDPKTVVDEQIQTYSPSMDVTFITDKGLEIIGGAVYRVSPSYEQKVTAGDATSKTKFHTTALLDRRFGLLRRAGAWSGGVVYSLGDESERDFEKAASDGSSIEGSETLFIPSRISVFGDFAAFAAVWDFEMAFVQARGKGPTNETGATLYTDYFEARFGGQYQVAGAFGLKLAVAHQTLSYASNEFITLDTIPVTSVKTLGVFGDQKNNAFVGLIVAQGQDGQSLPEFNAAYRLKAMALTTGFIFQL
jgi:hypothetical protein